MLSEQNGVCAICETLPDNIPEHWDQKLCVDHCHSTGKVRALLCNDCNYIVRKEHTPTRLEQAAEYLRLHDG